MAEESHIADEEHEGSYYAVAWGEGGGETKSLLSGLGSELRLGREKEEKTKSAKIIDGMRRKKM